jgi:hypothetical protein
MAAAALALTATHLPGAFANEGQYVAPLERLRCAPPVVARVGEHFGLKAFSYPWSPLYQGGEEDGRIVAGVCSRWPGNNSQVVAAFAYDAGVQYEKALLVAVVDARQDRVVAAYRGVTDDEVNGERVTEYSLKIDLAPYFLSPGHRAIGLRLNTNRDSCGQSGGLDNDLMLFIIDEQKLRPVLQTTTHHWLYDEGNRCEIGDTGQTDAQTYIAIEPTSSHGLADLRFTAKRTDNAKPLTAIVKFTGDHYDLTAWDSAFESWWGTVIPRPAVPAENP